MMITNTDIEEVKNYYMPYYLYLKKLYLLYGFNPIPNHIIYSNHIDTSLVSWGFINYYTDYDRKHKKLTEKFYNLMEKIEGHDE